MQNLLTMKTKMMSRLTPKEFAELSLLFAEHYEGGKHMRIGQTYMNVLGTVKMELYQEITATKYDPYHSDDRLSDFFKYLTGEGEIAEGDYPDW